MSNIAISNTGQTESYDEWLDQRLRMFVNHYRDYFPDALPVMDVAQICIPHDALGGLTPFEVSHGRTMPLTFDWEIRTQMYQTLPLKGKISSSKAQKMAFTLKKYVDVTREYLKQIQDKIAI